MRFGILLNGIVSPQATPGGKSGGGGDGIGISWGGLTFC